MLQRDLFISHSSADVATALSLVADFERHGISCWVASRDVPIGSAYQSEVVDAIGACRAVLLLFSGAANKSDHVLREVELAAQGRKPIYPLRIDSVEPSGGLRYMLANMQWVERRALGDRLVETIEQMLRASGGGAPPVAASTAAPPPATREPKSSAAIWLIAGAVVVVAAVGAAWLVMNRPAQPPQQSAAVTPAASTVPSAAPSTVPSAAPSTTPTPAPSAAPSVAPPPSPAPQVQPSSPTPATLPQPEPAPAAAPVVRSEPPAAPPTATPPPTASPPPAVARPSGEIVVASIVPTDVAKLDDTAHFFKECAECPVMAVVPAGRAAIGSPDDEPGHNASESPQRQVVFSEPFAVGRSEVTFDEWFACVAEGGCRAYRPGDYGWGTGKRPVINVSWVDATAYAEWLSRKTGSRYRLLSEAEWEYAARGCRAACPSTAFWFGNSINPDQANYDWRYSYEGSRKAQALRKTVLADSGAMNGFGLLHVLGNTREWVQDCWNSSLAGLPHDGTARSDGDCSRRVVRGGSWADEPRDVRTAKRAWELENERRAQIGFRVARPLNP